MKIDDLRSIGRILLKEIPAYRLADDAQSPIERGAGGDMTFPMDKRAEDIIFSSLEKLNVSCTVISEEYGIKEMGGGGLTFLIDPIDGSKNAVSGLPVFGTSIAAADGNRIGDVSMSYVINLVSGDEFWAERGKGSFLNDSRIQIQQDHAFKAILYEAQNPGRDIPVVLPVLAKFFRTRCLGSIALDLAYLAMGAASAFISPAPSRSFDFAGGWLLVKEAGGLFTDFSGKGLEEIEIGLGRSVPLLASADPQIHDALLKILGAGT